MLIANRTKKLIKYVFVIVIIVSVITFFTVTTMPGMIIQDNKLVIKGKYGITKNMNELVIIDTINRLPEIKSIDDGVSMFNMLKGSFFIDKNVRAKMFIYKKEPPYIYIEYKRANKLYLNFRKSPKTKEFYRELRVTKDQGALP